MVTSQIQQCLAERSLLLVADTKLTALCHHITTASDGGAGSLFEVNAEGVMITGNDNLIYVSKPKLTILNVEAEIELILAVAHQRNKTIRVTGALAFTGKYFAQMLEGPADSIAEVMTSIRRDDRHTEIRVLREEINTGRTFHDWDMAYAGPSRFISHHIDIFYDSQAAGTPSDVDRLVELLVEYTYSRSQA